MNTLPLTDIRNAVLASFPEALPLLEKATSEDEAQQIIESHLSQGLCAPGVLTKGKVQSYAEVIRYFYPSNFLKAKIDDIWSIFTQVIFVEASYVTNDEFASTGNVSKYSFLAGACEPILVKGNVGPDLELIELGVQKGGAISEIFKIDDPLGVIVREKLSYIVDQKNIPPTFIIETSGEGVVSFQLFYKNSTTLYERFSLINQLTFPRSYIRELAFSEIRRLNLDLSLVNIMINSEGTELKFIDGSYAFPKGALPHKISVLFASEVFSQHLPGPFSDSELAYINKINVAETCALLENHQLEKEAIQTYRCALLMLKQVIAFNAHSSNSITLEDLLVMINLSDPNGFSYKIKKQRSAGGPWEEFTCHINGAGTLFGRILEAKNKTDKEISQKIDEIFSMLVNLKTPGSQRPGTLNRGTIHDYYHKSKNIYTI